ncbi:alginate export family protein [Aquimarina sp. 2201CG5-10]|uniref:alginate export family protein n=1 Tax=Aquimarina callyspongiae TaxID=3098150 RepID=UPI002AB3F9DC|nr:alginate export family protein [Aquimarina sp. 2201CG5-10]MDY8134917.1 alginate export family protein [Aquimarina sp. 2201CG5-10]
MKRTKSITLIFLISFIAISTAQLKVDAELRPRFEYRHGFKTLFPDNEDPAAFVSQRTRLNVGYSIEKLNFYLSIQDIRVWGDVPQLNTADNNGSSVHQAWGEILFTPNLSLKLGRQEINLDDQRLFGSVNWAHQARSHDAALIKYNKESLSINLGFAFNQDNEALLGNTLTIPNTYKSIQYAWLHKEWKHFSGSFLFLNNGLQFIDPTNSDNDETRYSQTIGTHLKYNQDKLKLVSNLYYQFGNDVNNNDLSAYLLSLEANYQLAEKWKGTLGGELLSGNDDGTPTNGDNNAFNPFYGTNHKFNGLMDYFYVGNHIDNVGLIDLYAKIDVKLNSKSRLNIAGHYFSAAANFPGNDTDKTLGTEIDFVYLYDFQKHISFKAGYSHLFPSDGMEILKNNFDGNSNYWGWIMVTIKPTLFTSNNK